MNITQQALNRGMWQIGSQLADELIMNIAYGPNGPEYQGFAVPGSGNAEPVWRILRNLYDGDGLQIGVRFAGGTTGFDKVWDARASYTYS